MCTIIYVSALFSSSFSGDPAMKIQCPHCEEDFETKAIFKTTCPHCGNYVFIEENCSPSESQGGAPEPYPCIMTQPVGYLPPARW